MSYEYFYPGTPYSLDPGYSGNNVFTGYRIPAGQIGAPTSIQTANQIAEVTNRLNEGTKTVELQPISPEVFDQIPKQHFKEINRLTKLTGAETSVHAPMIDPAGFSREGWSDVGREEAERQLKSVVERAHELNPQGNIPVTIHASAIQGTEYSKPNESLIKNFKEQFKKDYGRDPNSNELKQLEESQIIAVNRETGQLAPIKREIKYLPGAGKIIRVPTQEVKTINYSEWINSVTQLAFYKKEADEVLGPTQAALQPLFENIEQGKKLTPQELSTYNSALQNLQKADLFLQNVETSFNNVYNKAYKYGDEVIKEKLKDISNDWLKNRNEIENIGMRIREGKASPDEQISFILKKSELIDKTINKIKQFEHHSPNVYQKVEDFARSKSADTLGNVAFEAYKKYGSSSPMVSIENLYSGMAFSKADELKKLVEDSRKKFVENAKKDGISSSEAESAAKKLIGVTWDVGHLNILKKGGFTDKELAKETEQIAPFVKHVHITDNFGYGDSHLPPGMGNVPIKQIMEELEKAGFSGKKIVEAGGFVQHFKTSPSQYVLEAFGSPLYPAMAAPYWNQAMGVQGNYFQFPSAYLPEQHFSLYGGGMSGLPAELGGQMPGKASRVSGTPMD